MALDSTLTWSQFEHAAMTGLGYAAEVQKDVGGRTPTWSQELPMLFRSSVYILSIGGVDNYAR